MDLNDNNILEFLDKTINVDLLEEHKKHILGKFFKDLKIFLNKVKKCDGKIIINYKKGIPMFMAAGFESKEEKEEYTKYKDFVGDYGFIAHKKYGLNKSLYGEKNYKYFKIDLKGEYGLIEDDIENDNVE